MFGLGVMSPSGRFIGMLGPPDGKSGQKSSGVRWPRRALSNLLGGGYGELLQKDVGNLQMDLRDNRFI